MILKFFFNFQVSKMPENKNSMSQKYQHKLLEVLTFAYSCPS